MGWLDLFRRRTGDEPVKKAFPAPTPEPVRQFVLQMHRDGHRPEEIQEALADEGVKISIPTINRITRPERDKAAATAAAVQSPTSAVEELNHTVKALAGIAKTLADIRGDAPAAVTALPAAQGGYGEDDPLWEVRQNVARRLATNPEVQAAIEKQMIAEITGGRSGRRSPLRELLEYKREIDELSAEFGGGGGSVWAQIGQSVAAALLPALPLLFGQRSNGGLPNGMPALPVSQPAGQLPAASAGAGVVTPNPVGVPAAAADASGPPLRAATEAAAGQEPDPEPPLLLGLFSLDDVLAWLAIDDPEEAADAAWAQFEEQLAQYSEDDQAHLRSYLEQFVAISTLFLGVYLNQWASQPGWGPVISRVFERDEWFEAFRARLGDLLDGDEEDGGSDGDDGPDGPDASEAVAAAAPPADVKVRRARARP